MNKAIKSNSCILAMLLCTMSCSKEQQPVSENQVATNVKATGKTSSMVSYNKDNTTTVTTIPLNLTRKILYSIGPLTVQAGDVVSAHLQQELVQTSNYHVMLVGYIVATSSPTGTTGDIGTLAKPSGSNLNPPQEGHAEIITRNGSFQFTQNASNVYINAVFYADRLTTAIPPDVEVPAGPYGELVAVVERGVGYYETNSYAPGLPYDSGFGKYYAPRSPNLAVQYSIGPLSIPANTMVDVRYLTEVTSEAALKTSTPHDIRRSVITGNSGTLVNGTELVKANIQTTPRYYEHHYTYSFAGGAHFSTANPGAYFNAVVYARNVVNSDHLYIESAGSYGHFKVETRPYNGFWKDTGRNISTVNSTSGQVLYSVGPINVNAGDLLEIRYHGIFVPTASTPFTSKIVRATSSTATSGVLVQPHLWRRYGPQYKYNGAIHSTAELITTTASNQYYNVVVAVPSGGSLAVEDWGQLEVVKR